MINLGLAGLAGSGKDIVADYLVSRYGFVKYSFSDALYREVAEAFGLEDESLLRDRETKDTPTQFLTMRRCGNSNFDEIVFQIMHKKYGSRLGTEWPMGGFSPRQILQWWGTEYRRAQDPTYWVYKADERIYRIQSAFPYPELQPQLFVNTSVRFENESDWITNPQAWYGGRWFGNIWHIHRDTATPVHAHESETPLPVLEGEREIWNNAGLEQLYRGIDLLLSTNARFVRCEPMLPMTEPEEQV